MTRLATLSRAHIEGVRRAYAVTQVMTSPR